jgi:hypothetical protein
MSPVRTAAIILALSVASASGQVPPVPASTTPGYRVRKCTVMKVPIGRLPNATGTVSLLLGKNGTPDTSSIAVLQVAGISVNGLRSAAVRRLSACQYDMGKSAPKASVGVVLELATNDTAIQVGVATPTGTPGPPLAMESAETSFATFPLPLDDSRIEERPRRLHCGDPTPGMVSMQQMQQMEEWFRTSTGTVVAEVLVAADGKPDHRVKVIRTSNPSATVNLVNWLVGCEFVPGRYRGIAVPAFMRDSIGLATTKRP